MNKLGFSIQARYRVFYPASSKVPGYAISNGDLRIMCERKIMYEG